MLFMKKLLLLCASVRARGHIPNATEQAVLEAQDGAGQGHAQLQRLEPAAAVAEREAARLKNALAAFYQGKPTDAKVATLAINISLYAQELPAGSGCPGDRRAAGVHRGGQAAEPGAQERRSACARPAWT